MATNCFPRYSLPHASSSQDLFSYDVTPDGRRSLVSTKIDNSSPAPQDLNSGHHPGVPQ